MNDKRFIFVIGFNRCGLTSLEILFRESGVRTLHAKTDDADTILGTQMAANLSAGRPLMAGLYRFAAFLDMSVVTPWMVFEGCRLFWQLHAEHPDSYFILNTRPVEHWVLSRESFMGGIFVEQYARAFGYDEIKIQQVWRKQFLTHQADVRAHFAENGGKFLEFDIEEGDPALIRDFVAPDYVIDTRLWGHWNATDYDALVADEDNRTAG